VEFTARILTPPGGNVNDRFGGRFESQLSDDKSPRRALEKGAPLADNIKLCRGIH